MTETFYDGQVVLHTGKCEVVLRDLPDNSVDSIVTDPPYNLTFMSKPWDAYDGHEDAGFAYWLSGLIDGEGHFAIKQHSRGTHAPAFSLKMRSDERGTLEIIKRKTGLGSIIEDAGHQPNPTTSWVVQNKADCQQLCDLLDKYPLRAKKLADYRLWREAVCEWTSRPRGNRWHGPADNTKMAALRERLMAGRAYVDIPWSGNEFQDWCRLWAAECLRVLKPGGHLLAFGGTRTYHRMVCAIEDAGFEIRDSLHWMYGSGFPKSLNVSKAIDKAGGASAADDAATWAGFGTALKPSHEPIVVARKPLTGTVTQNVLTHGTGAINVAGTRVGTTKDTPASPRRAPQGPAYGDLGNDPGTGTGWDADTGRWPPNVLLTHSAECVLRGTRKVRNPSGSVSGKEPSAPTDEIYGKFAGRVPYKARGSGGIWTHGNGVPVGPQYGEPDGTETVDAWKCAPDCPVAALDSQSGVTISSGGSGLKSTQSRGGLLGGKLNQEAAGAHLGGVGDKGGASRFFPQFGWDEEDFWPFKYQAKAPKKERPKLPDGTAWPTVKPLALMRWLVKLVTPPGGTCLDPFAGTGTTAQACMAEDFNCILIDNDKDALNLIRKRMTRDVQPGMF